MKTRKLLLYLVLITSVSAVVLSSCKKALDFDPTTEYSNENFWQETTQATAALYGAYTLLQSAMGPEFVYFGEARTDNVAQNPVSLNSQTLNLLTNNVNSSLSYTSWNGFYKVVNQTNLLIKNLEIMKNKGLYAGKAGELASVKGQAYALRAYCYFYMTRLWGGLPLIKEPLADANENTQIARADTAAVYQLIKSDLDSAIVAGIPAAYTTNTLTRGQLTMGAVNAIYTDFSMWRHQYDEALLYSQKVISNAGYSLTGLYVAGSTIDYNTNPALIDNTAYAKMFTQGYSTESIFEIDYNFAERATRSYLIMVYGDQGFQPAFKANPVLINKFSTADLRAKINFDAAEGIVKYFEKSGFNRASMDDKNIIVYRLADILLLRAEALNRKGRTPEAIALLNQIKKRANGTELLPANYTGLSVDQVEDIILEERARELCFEGKRWYDLVRTGRAIRVMQPINGLSNPDNLLWPIYINEIRLNQKLVQNSFYQ